MPQSPREKYNIPRTDRTWGSFTVDAEIAAARCNNVYQPFTLQRFMPYRPLFAQKALYIHTTRQLGQVNQFVENAINLFEPSNEIIKR